MLRERLNDELKSAMKAKDETAVSTLRLILAAIKDRDIAARAKGAGDGISEDDIMNLLQTMVRQRRDSIALYEQGGRLELADQEAREIAIIERFLPPQLSDEEIRGAVNQVIEEIDAKSLKDMGRTMAALKERYAGQMEFSKVRDVVKEQLS